MGGGVVIAFLITATVAVGLLLHHVVLEQIPKTLSMSSLTPPTRCRRRFCRRLCTTPEVLLSTKIAKNCSLIVCTYLLLTLAFF